MRSVAIIACLLCLLFSSCFFIERQQEKWRAPLKTYMQDEDVGFGAIVYVDSGGQAGNILNIDSRNFAITSYPYSSLIETSGHEPKYQYFRIVGKDTIRLHFNPPQDDSFNCVSTTPMSYSASNLKYQWFLIQFYDGPYPERVVGIHIDSTEQGRWDKALTAYLEELEAKGFKPQVR